VAPKTSAERTGGSARTTQLVSPVLHRKDIDVSVLQSLRANTVIKMLMNAIEVLTNATCTLSATTPREGTTALVKTDTLEMDIIAQISTSVLPEAMSV